MMNKIFYEEIGETLEVYINVMIVKSNADTLYAHHLNRVLKRVWKYNMRLSPKKCTFVVRAGKFLGFYLTRQGIEVNPDKSEMIIQMKAPTLNKDIYKLNGIMAA